MARVRTWVEIWGAPALSVGLFILPRIRTWGTTPAELTRGWPGDELVPRPGFVWTNAVTVERPAAEVWPWVNQLGQGRGGLYSYDWLENAILAGVHSVSEIVPELQRPLEVGDRVIRMTKYAPFNPVARYEAGHALVLGGVTDSPAQLQAGRPSSTWAFIVEPSGAGSCRLVVRSRGAGLAPRLQGPAQFVMQRRMMLGIKQRAEGTWSASPSDVLVPLSWFATAAIAGRHGIRAFRPGGGSRDAVMSGVAWTATELLLFWDVPPRARAGLVAALAGSSLRRFSGPASCPPRAGRRP